MEVQWNVVLSIVSPGKLFLADYMALFMSAYNMRSTLDTEAERQKIQSRLEYSSKYRYILEFFCLEKFY